MSTKAHYTPRPKAGQYITKEQCEAFVSNALTQQADELMGLVSETFRQFYKTLTEHGALVPAGVESIKLESDLRASAEAAQAAVETPAPKLFDANGVASDSELVPPNLTIQ